MARLGSIKRQVTYNDLIFNIILYGISAFILLIVVYPLYFIIIASFSNPTEVANGHVWFVPSQFTVDGYKEIMRHGELWMGYRNTIVYTALGTVIGLAVNIPAAYALSRKDLVGRRFFTLYFVFTMFFGGGLIPTYFTIRNFGLYDTIWVMVLPFSVAVYHIIIARTFFDSSLPQGILDAAMIDGCGNLRFFFQIALPLSKAVLYVKGVNLRDFNENPMFQEMEKTTNVHIDWQYAGDADWGEQKSLLLAGGDLPDVFFGNNSLGDVDVLTNLDLFIPLEDYIEEYCPNIKAAYEAEPIMRKMITQPDGHIYTLSSKLPLRPKACDVLYINQKWLDNLNLDTPTTVDEWYEVLKAFKEQDANGNGDPNDEIPFGGCGKGDMCGHWIKFITPWGLAESMEGNYLALDQKTGEPIFIPADERYKEAVQFFERLYAEGIMDPEYFTQDGSQADAKLKNEEITLVGTNIAWEVAADTNPHSDEYVPLLPLAGPRGGRLTRANDGVIIYRRNEFTVTTACEHPEIAMRWADYYSTDEISIQSYWGPFGEALEKQEDGTITFLDPPEGKNGDVWYWEITCRDYGPKYVTPETEAKIKLPPDSGDGAKLAVDEVYKDYAAKPFPVVNYTPEQMDEISKLTADIYKYVNECWANWIVNGGIEDQWDSYIAQLKQMGLDRLMEIYQEAAEAYNAD